VSNAEISGNQSYPLGKIVDIPSGPTIWPRTDLESCTPNGSDPVRNLVLAVDRDGRTRHSCIMNKS